MQLRPGSCCFDTADDEEQGWLSRARAEAACPGRPSTALPSFSARMGALSVTPRLWPPCPSPAMTAEEETIAVIYPGALLPPWDGHLGLKKIHLLCF